MTREVILLLIVSLSGRIKLLQSRVSALEEQLKTAKEVTMVSRCCGASVYVMFHAFGGKRWHCWKCKKPCECVSEEDTKISRKAKTAKAV